jgi:methyltransferase family protein
MSSGTLDHSSKTAPGVARKVWREVSRTFRPRTPTDSAGAPLATAEDTTLAGYVRENVLPRTAKVFDRYLPSRWMGSQGIDLRESEQLARIEKWRGASYQELYRNLRNNAEINCPFDGQSYLGSTCLHNGWYPTPDAEIYASMIYDFRPDQIVEVGSGFSTLIARATLEFAQLKCPLTVVDPAPRTNVERAADKVIYERVEDSKLEKFALTEKSLLFIDSSHITRPRGDVPYLYCEVLPQLPAGTVVHFHDIFIPYDYPTCYDHLCWTEQYVLHALLAQSPRYRTLLSTQYLSRHHVADMQATFGPQVGADNLFYGASYWIQIQ